MHFFLRGCQRTLSVAAAFWGACLVLVLAESAIGASMVIAALYFLSIPLLVAVLTWVNKGIVFDRVPRTIVSVFVLGFSVLISSSLIIFVGLLAASNLKTLMSAI
jgi:hypothetical protein